MTRTKSVFQTSKLVNPVARLLLSSRKVTENSVLVDKPDTLCVNASNLDVNISKWFVDVSVDQLFIGYLYHIIAVGKNTYKATSEVNL